MQHRQHIQPNRDLMARLHAACAESQDRSEIGRGSPDTSEYLIEAPAKRSTLGSSINYNPADA